MVIFVNTEPALMFSFFAFSCSLFLSPSLPLSLLFPNYSLQPRESTQVLYNQFYIQLQPSPFSGILFWNKVSVTELPSLGSNWWSSDLSFQSAGIVGVSLCALPLLILSVVTTTWHSGFPSKLTTGHLMIALITLYHESLQIQSYSFHTVMEFKWWLE